MNKRYTQWLNQLDQNKLDALIDRKAWLGILVFFTLTLLGINWLSAGREFIGLQLNGPLIALSVVAIHAIAISTPGIQSKLGPMKFGTLMLSTSAAFQTFMWSVPLFSNDTSAPMLAVLPILLAAYHAEFFQLTLKQMWGAIPIIVSLMVALLIANNDYQYTLVSVGGLFALAASFTMGNYARQTARLVQESADMKAAIEAQTLMDTVESAEKSKDLLQELRGTNHDAGNALTGILMNVELLTSTLEESADKPLNIKDLLELNTDISNSANRLRKLIERGREVGNKASSNEAVNLNNVIEQAVNETAQSYSKNLISIVDKIGCDSIFMELNGGELALHRVLVNLMKNAFEGNGKEGASSVNLEIGENNNFLMLSVRDDGPGFTADQLSSPTVNFRTSKEQGSGLGLYTSERLIAANSGKLVFENNETLGASVSILLPKTKIA